MSIKKRFRKHGERSRVACFILALSMVGLAVPCQSLTGSQSSQDRGFISTSWTEEPLANVLLAFSAFTGRSILPASGASELVTARIVDQPWDVALGAIASSLGMVIEEDEHGIIYVTSLADVREREKGAPLVSRAYPLSYADAVSVASMTEPLLSPRGSLSAGLGTMILVTDLPAVHEAVRVLVSEVDVEIPQVSIRAKIVFVNRTKLDDLGLSYELTDTDGEDPNNQTEPEEEADDDAPSDDTVDPTTMEVVDPTDGDGGSDEPEVSLGGNSIEALGNAAVRIVGPSLRLITTLVLGRHRLITFLDALEAASLSEIEAAPQVTTLAGYPAEIHVGEVTPIRTIDAGSAGGAAYPTAQVSQQETGIILRATPQVTADGGVILDLEAERSAAEPAASDVGYIFRTQRASTRVLVDDGGTVVIAGLTQRERVETVSGIPLLMHLPGLGRLFRVTHTDMVQRDLVILVTPTIVGRGSTLDQNQ